MGNEHVSGISRRKFMRTSMAFGLATGMAGILPAYARSQGVLPAPRLARETAYDLNIGKLGLNIAGKKTTATAINGTVPGPLLRFKEGDEAVLRVTNNLSEDTSIHWHGLILPSNMDGVPGLSYAGIKPGETFTYRFPVIQSGTYWYHSHSGMQEQLGVYGPIVIDPAGPEPHVFDREYIVVLGDWTFENPHHVLRKLRKRPGYYNYQRMTFADLLKKEGPRLKERLAWGRMRMDATDLADVTGATYTYLMNGLAPGDNWTGLFKPGERVRLRFINAGADSFFDVRIPGLPMTVVQADGQNVEPVPVDEFRIAIAETYDVIVEPKEDKAYTLFAESMDRTGFASGTLAPRAGMTAPIPERRKRAVRSMADMGMDHGNMEGMDHGKVEGMDHGNMDQAEKPAMDHGSMDHGEKPAMDHGNMDHGKMDAAETPAMDHANMDHSQMAGMASALAPPGEIIAVAQHGPDSHGPGNAAVPMQTQSRLHEPGIGLGEDSRRVLVYTDLKGLVPVADQRPPGREIELHLTGNMERYMWSFNGKEYSMSPEPIQIELGERVRLILVNDTMMEHPIHLHGMWMQLENGTGANIPRKHTVNVKPAERLSVLITPDVPGPWAFHCHILYHMDMGMFRVVEVTQPDMAEVKR